MIWGKILPNMSSSAISFLQRQITLICFWNGGLVVRSRFNQDRNLCLRRAFGHKWLWSTKITLWALRWSSEESHRSKWRADISNKQSSAIWTSKWQGWSWLSKFDLELKPIPFPVVLDGDSWTDCIQQRTNHMGEACECADTWTDTHLPATSID